MIADLKPYPTMEDSGVEWGDVKKLVETCISDSWSCSRFTP